VGGENVMNARCFMWTFTLPLVASPASTCYPASLIFTGASSIICQRLVDNALVAKQMLV